MRYFWTLFWTMLLMFMLTYVVSSMQAVPFQMETALILGIVGTVMIYIISAVIPNTSEKDGAH